MKNAPSAALEVNLRDYLPEMNTFLDDVQSGLSKQQKTLPSKYFYDEEGSRLFDEITGLDAYYPTRTELGIMRDRVDEMAAKIGEDALVIEYGSGSSVKTRILLDALDSPAGYVPIDISREHLMVASERLIRDYPDLDVLPVCADYSQQLPIPQPRRPVKRRLVYFPGSTIGNFDPKQSRAFLDRVSETADSLLIGVDLVKDTGILEAAYDDPEGVTAAFNQNLLRHINRELEGEFDLDAFRHRAVFNNDESRIEMHLVSERDQAVRIGDQTFSFAEGEHIVTEYSYKFTVDGFARHAAEAGLVLDQAWVDAKGYFSVQLFHTRS